MYAICCAVAFSLGGAMLSLYRKRGPAVPPRATSVSADVPPAAFGIGDSGSARTGSARYSGSAARALSLDSQFSRPRVSTGSSSRAGVQGSTGDPDATARLLVRVGLCAGSTACVHMVG